MSTQGPDLNQGSGSRPHMPFTTTKRGPVPVRRAATSSRLAREARQQRLAWLSLFGVIALVIIILVAGALGEYVIGPAQPVATVNGVTIHTDVFRRYQRFENFVLQNQITALQNRIAQLQADTKQAALAAALVPQLQQQLNVIQGNSGNIAAYTLQQMEFAIEQTQAAATLNTVPTAAQLDAEMLALQKQAGGPVPYKNVLQSTGVHEDDLRTFFAAPAMVQTNVTNYYAARVPRTQSESEARHILVTTKARALLLYQAIRQGASFAALAKTWSIDNGLQAGSTLTGTAKLQAEAQSSAFNGGWLRDPSQAFVPNKPTWITPQTQYVAPVLDAILSMKAGETRIVQSQFGFHVIQVAAHRVRKVTKAEIATQAQQKFQQWQTSVTSSIKNHVSPSDPYVQYPASTPLGQ